MRAPVMSASRTTARTFPRHVATRRACSSAVRMRVRRFSTRSRLTFLAGDSISLPHSTAFDSIDFRVSSSRLPWPVGSASNAPSAGGLGTDRSVARASIARCGEGSARAAPSTRRSDSRRSGSLGLPRGGLLVEVGVIAEVHLAERPERDVGLAADLVTTLDEARPFFGLYLHASACTYHGRPPSLGDHSSGTAYLPRKGENGPKVCVTSTPMQTERRCVALRTGQRVGTERRLLTERCARRA